MAKRRTGGKRGNLLQVAKPQTKKFTKEELLVPRLKDVTSKTDDTTIVQTTTNIEESKKAADFVRKAFDKKNIVISCETERLGYVADFAHFDFMVHPENLTPTDMVAIKNARSDMDVLMIFWAKMWPYVDKLLKNYEIVENAFQYIQDENIAVEKKHAQQSLVLRIYDQFMEENNDIKCKFNRYYKKKKEEYDKLAEEAVKKYQAEQESDSNKELPKK